MPLAAGAWEGVGGVGVGKRVLGLARTVSSLQKSSDQHGLPLPRPRPQHHCSAARVWVILDKRLASGPRTRVTTPTVGTTLPVQSPLTCYIRPLEVSFLLSISYSIPRQGNLAACSCSRPFWDQPS